MKSSGCLPIEPPSSGCRDFLKQELSGCAAERPVYILGESFGGVLALAVAALHPAVVDRLVLVNPASSYPQSIWPSLGPVLPNLPSVRSTFSFPGRCQ